MLLWEADAKLKKLILLLLFILLAIAVSGHRYFGQGIFGWGNFGTNTDPDISAYQPNDLTPEVDLDVNMIFNVTANDLDLDTLTYNWTINGTYNVSNQNLTINFSVDGVYNVSVNVSDNQSHTFVSWIVSITDTTPPTMCGDAYIGISYGSTFSGIICTATDANGIDSYWLNETGNFSIDGSGSFATIGIVMPWVYHILIIVNDTWDNRNNATWIINVSDTSAPALDILSPTDEYYQNVTCINLSIRDDFPNNITLNDSRWNLTFINNSEAHFCNYTAQEEGNYTVEVQFNDTYGNTGYENITYVIDRTSPVVSLVHPANMSNWTTSSTVTLTYNVTDLNPIANCYYDMDSALFGRGGSDTSITRDINQTFSDTFTNAMYEWYINCTDEAGNVNQSVFFNLTVNYAPTITPAQPSGGATGVVPSNQWECEATQNMSWYNGICYECDGTLIEKDSEILCAKCPQGFIYDAGQCTSETKTNYVVPILILLFVTVLLVTLFTQKSKRKQKKEFKKMMEEVKKEKKEEKQNE